MKNRGRKYWAVTKPVYDKDCDVFFEPRACRTNDIRMPQDIEVSGLTKSQALAMAKILRAICVKPTDTATSVRLDLLKEETK